MQKIVKDDINCSEEFQNDIVEYLMKVLFVMDSMAVVIKLERFRNFEINTKMVKSLHTDGTTVSF